MRPTGWTIRQPTAGSNTTMTEQTKLKRLDRYLSTTDCESVWLATPPLFAWLTGGDNLVAREGEAGCAAVGYDGDELTVLTADIEAERLADEELDDAVTVESFPWHETGLIDALCDRVDAPAAADIDVPGFDRIDVPNLTQPLTSTDVRRYRTVATETATAVETVAEGAKPTDTERELAARLHRELNAKDIGSPVVLVGGEDRVQRYRHFTPKDVSIGGYAVLTVVGVRQGQHVAVTRTVAFSNAPDWLSERYADTCRVAATAAAATREAGRDGGTASNVLDSIRRAYTQLGYDDEWTTHHQGGAVGYASREWLVTPDNERPIRRPLAVGYNPTVPGAKSEDTMLIDDGIDVLTDTGALPTHTVEAVGFDVTVELPDLVDATRR